jgi:hypothetical protein
MTSVHTLRINHCRNIAADRAIVDLLELQELDLAPGILTTTQLRELWEISQSRVSRRLTAIDHLGPWRLQPQMGREGGYWLAPRLKPAPPIPEPGPSPRERWEALRHAWRELVA